MKENEVEKIISFQKHKEIGMICKILNVRLVKTGVKIANSEKTKNKGKVASYHHRKANDALSKFKDHMEEIMFAEYPEEATTDIYYGSRPDNFKEEQKTIGWVIK